MKSAPSDIIVPVVVHTRRDPSCRLLHVGDREIEEKRETHNIHRSRTRPAKPLGGKR